MVQVVPTQPVPRQNLQCQLNGQAVTLDIYQLAYGLFIDVYVQDTLIIAGVICENLNRIVRSAYLGFIGDFVFVDTVTATDPSYLELGTQHFLMYLDPADLGQV